MAKAKYRVTATHAFQLRTGEKISPTCVKREIFSKLVTARTWRPFAHIAKRGYSKITYNIEKICC
jgi:hypothetical protein